MGTNPFYDSWLLLIGSTSDQKSRGDGWLLTVPFLALLVASTSIARRNWNQGAAHRSKERIANWFTRVMIGATPFKWTPKLI